MAKALRKAAKDRDKARRAAKLELLKNGYKITQLLDAIDLSVREEKVTGARASVKLLGKARDIMNKDGPRVPVLLDIDLVRERGAWRIGREQWSMGDRVEKELNPAPLPAPDDTQADLSQLPMKPGLSEVRPAVFHGSEDEKLVASNPVLMSADPFGFDVSANRPVPPYALRQFKTAEPPKAVVEFFDCGKVIGGNSYTSSEFNYDERTGFKADREACAACKGVVFYRRSCSGPGPNVDILALKRPGQRETSVFVFGYRKK